MVNLRDIVEAMNIRQVFNSYEVNTSIKELTDITSSIMTSICPANRLSLDPVIVAATKGVAKIWLKVTKCNLIQGNNRISQYLKQMLLNSPKEDVIRPQILAGVWGLLHRGSPLKRISEKTLVGILNKPWDEVIVHVGNDLEFNRLDLFPAGNCMLKVRTSLKGKDIRSIILDQEPLLVTKAGILLSPLEAKSFWSKVNKIKNVKLKNDLLRLIHGDVFYKDKLFRQGREESPLCVPCGIVESLEHKTFECVKARTLWRVMRDNHGILLGNDLGETIVLNTSAKALMLISKSLHTFLYNENLNTSVIPGICNEMLDKLLGGLNL